MVMRQGSVMRLRPGATEEYERLHREVWPDVIGALRAAGIRDYSIHRFGDLLFARSEYVGSDFDADMARLALHEPSRRWNALMSELQLGVAPEAPSRWLVIPELFYLD